MLRRVTNAALLTLVLLAAACAVPLGPGFYIEKEFLEVRFVPGAPPHLEIRATFTLRNSGNVPLGALDLSLPDEKHFGMQDLRITVDGTAVSLRPPAADSPSTATARIAFASPWPQKSKHSVVVSYDLPASSSTPTRLDLTENSFSLPAADWYPHLLAPTTLFAEGDKPPKVFDISVLVPQDFLVHAAGQPYGKKRRATETEFRFRLREGDFSPFVVAGRYHEQKFVDSNGTVFLWTFQPLPPDHVQQAGARLAFTAKFYDSAFGPRGKGSRPVWLVEMGTLDAPEAVIFLPDQIAAGLAEPGQRDVPRKLPGDDFLLAFTWFEYLAKPEGNLDLKLANALAEYAETAAAVARGHTETFNTLVRATMSLFDIEIARGSEKETTLAELALSNSQRPAAWADMKVILMVVALRDECGTEVFHRALHRMVQFRRSATWQVADLQSALEAESGRNLGDLFRRWLNQTGIPADFRARYETKK